MKKSRKLIALLLVMVLAFSFSFSAMAVTWPSDNYAYYVIEPKPEPIPGSSVVYLTINSSKPSGTVGISNGPLAITLGASKVYHVNDVLVAAHAAYSSYSFYDQAGLPITSSSSLLDSVSYVANDYDPISTYPYSGWSFRINDKYPLISNDPTSGPMGASIAEANVNPGDTINLYYSNMAQTLPTEYVRVQSASPLGSGIEVALFSSTSYYDSSTWYWNISNFTSLTASSITVYIDGAAKTADYQSASHLYKIDNVSAGTHTIYVQPTYNGEGVPYRVGVPVQFTI
ncbi:MAG: hypothetical protein LBM98_12535 [Oscillospiraceae bacterium]|jgi:hypothetical protein|nr:hypothetical protein [Oscillospiraceae bacterium]